MYIKKKDLKRIGGNEALAILIATVVAYAWALALSLGYSLAYRTNFFCDPGIFEVGLSALVLSVIGIVYITTKGSVIDFRKLVGTPMSVLLGAVSGVLLAAPRITAEDWARLFLWSINILGIAVSALILIPLFFLFALEFYKYVTKKYRRRIKQVHIFGLPYRIRPRSLRREILFGFSWLFFLWWFCAIFSVSYLAMVIIEPTVLTTNENMLYVCRQYGSWMFVDATKFNSKIVSTTIFRNVEKGGMSLQKADKPLVKYYAP